MATQLQLRKGTKVQNDAFTGAEGELTYDSTSKGLRLHDGVQQGGYMVDPVVAWQAPTAENNYTWYRKYSSGWVEQGGLCSGTAENNPVTMLIEMRDTEYQILAISDPTDSVNSWGWVTIIRNSKTTTGFSLGCRYASGSVLALRTHWQVNGMAA